MNFIALCQMISPVYYYFSPTALFIIVLILISLIAAVFIKCLTGLISHDSSKEKKVISSVCIAASVASVILLVINNIDFICVITSGYHYEFLSGFTPLIHEFNCLDLQIPVSIMFGIASYSFFHEKRDIMPVVLPAAAAAVFSILYRFLITIPFYSPNKFQAFSEIIIIVVTANICLLINVLRKKLKFT